MKDPETELLTLLTENWALTGSYSKKNIRFHRAYVDPKLLRPKPQVIVGHVRAQQEMLPETAMVQLHGEYRVTATVYVWSQDSSIPKQEDAKDGKWTIMEEIQRILKEATLPSGWEWAYVEAHENRDEPLLSPPLMGEHLIVFVKYTRT